MDKKTKWAIYSPSLKKYYKYATFSGYSKQGEVYEIDFCIKLYDAFLAGTADCKWHLSYINNIDKYINSKGDFKMVKIACTYEVVK